MEILSQINPGEPGGVLYKKVKISNAELLAMFTTPLELVAAPGVGKVVRIYGKSSLFLHSTVAYITNTTVNILYGTTVHAVFTTLLAGGVDKYLGLSEGNNALLLSNTALNINVGTGNPGTSTATNYLIVELYYQIVPSADV